MMTSEKRTCNGCNYPVTYHVINEGYDPHTYRQFVYVTLTGSHAGMAETGGYCPKCRRELTLESTSPVVEPKAAPQPMKKSKVAKAETVLLLADDSEDSYHAIHVLADARIPFAIQRIKRGGPSLVFKRRRTIIGLAGIKAYVAKIREQRRASWLKIK